MSKRYISYIDHLDLHVGDCGEVLGCHDSGYEFLGCTLGSAYHGADDEAWVEGDDVEGGGVNGFKVPDCFLG